MSELIDSFNPKVDTQRHKDALPISDPRWQEREEYVPPGKVKLGLVAKITGTALAAVTLVGAGYLLFNKNHESPENNSSPIASQPTDNPTISQERKIVGTIDFPPRVDVPVTKIQPGTVEIILRDEKDNGATFRRAPRRPDPWAYDKDKSKAENDALNADNSVSVANIRALNKTAIGEDTKSIGGTNLLECEGQAVDENFRGKDWFKFEAEVAHPIFDEYGKKQEVIEYTILYVSKSNMSSKYVRWDKEINDLPYSGPTIAMPPQDIGKVSIGVNLG